MGNVEIIRELLLLFQKYLKSRKGKNVTKAVLASFEEIVNTFNTEFPVEQSEPEEPEPEEPDNPPVDPQSNPVIVIPVPKDYSPYPDPQGNVVYVSAGKNLQAAYDAAAPGTTLMLDPDTDYIGRLQLKSKATNAPVVIRPKLDLPLSRLNTKSLPFKLPRIVYNDMDFINTAPGAHDAMIMGVEIFAPPGQTIVSIGSSYETKIEELPDNIWFDRVWIHCDPLRGGHRGIATNGRKQVVLRSVIEEFWQSGRDSQALGGWSGTGPIWVEDCFLSASGENVLFGGATPTIATAGPTGFVMRRCNLVKPLTWKQYRGSVKNLFELKNMRGALIEECVFENSWVDAQDGHAVLFTVRTDASHPYATVADVIFRNNVIKNIEGYVFDFLGSDDGDGVATYPSVKMHNIEIYNNLAVSSNTRGAFIIQRGCDNLKVRHNTFLGMTYHGIAVDGRRDTMGKPFPMDLLNGFEFTSNIMQVGVYGLISAGIAPGTPSLNPWLGPNSTFTKNVIEVAASRPDDPWPADNTLLAPTTLQAQLAADKSVKIGSTADVVGTDGKVVGADIAVLKAKMTGLGVTW